MLDASALLALMLGERGADTISTVLPSARLSAVNLSEVVAKLQERAVPDDVIADSLAELNLDVVAFDQPQALRAGLLRQATRAAGLSLGDRACLAAAAEAGATAITTDRVWGGLDLGISIEVAR
ncbi:PIN domain-containing protein [Sphingomonas psychrotolerans]|nr:PIN domain-containing protein [Sphingomonas psychrotolerans]